VSRNVWIAIASFAVAGGIIYFATRESSPTPEHEKRAEVTPPEDIVVARRSGTLRPIWERKAAAEKQAAAVARGETDSQTQAVTDATQIEPTPHAVTAAQTFRSMGPRSEPSEAELAKLQAKYERLHGPMTESQKQQFAKTIAAKIRRSKEPVVERVPGQRKMQGTLSCTGPQAVERYKTLNAIEQAQMRERCEPHGFVPPQ
jgi:hypothetical protein